MIYVDMKCFQMKKNVDLRIDETLTVEEILREIGRVISVNRKSAQVVSVNEKKILCKSKSLDSQGVVGGDTLILISNDGGEICDYKN